MGCHDKKNKLEIPERIIDNKVCKLDSLKELIPERLKPLTDNDWITQYSSYITKENPGFKLDSNKVLTYWVVPLLSIQGSVLVKDSINLLRYLEHSHLIFDGATCYVLEDDMPIAMFLINDSKVSPIIPTNFMESLNKRTIEGAMNSKLYFKISIKDKSGTFHLPGIVFLSENKFKVLCYEDNKTYPIKEIYRTLFSNEEHFRKWLNRIAERNKK